MEIGDFKDAMAQIPTSVALISLWDAKDIKACTISSLVSVDVVSPTLMFVLKNTSSTLNRIKSDLRFSVSILTTNQILISQTYSNSNSKSNSPPDTNFGLNENDCLPVLIDAHSTFFCKLESCLELKNATIVFASVNDVIKGNTHDPLVYFARKYFALNEINLESH
jgi:flavin reductase (DIM6/NTAB) family NADH-FMN oxidoreductase RutF